MLKPAHYAQWTGRSKKEHQDLHQHFFKYQ